LFKNLHHLTFSLGNKLCGAIKGGDMGRENLGIPGRGPGNSTPIRYGEGKTANSVSANSIGAFTVCMGDLEKFKDELQEQDPEELKEFISDLPTLG
jgi:hypothetical protein